MKLGPLTAAKLKDMLVEILLQLGEMKQQLQEMESKLEKKPKEK